MRWPARRKAFREILAGARCVHPGTVFDPVSARIAEDSIPKVLDIDS